MFKMRDYLILVAAATSMALSIGLWFGGFGPPDRAAGMFVGVWVPSILALGCFAKLVRMQGTHE
jgi:hypothetical protein